jgi:hypothetical protein
MLLTELAILTPPPRQRKSDPQVSPPMMLILVAAGLCPPLALSEGSASVLHAHLVAVGPTIIIILGFVLWAPHISLLIVSFVALAPTSTDNSS